VTPPDPKPSLYRVYSGGHSGTTAFFRNRPFLETLAALLAESDPPLVRVFVHACSVGAEPYSLALWCLHRPWPLAPRHVEIVASDIELAFLETARQGIYPRDVLDPLTDEERSWFVEESEGVRVPASTRALVRFLPPMSFVNGDPGEDFDAVLIMNGLTYVTPDDQRRAILLASRRARRVLGLTAFHPDSIKLDVTDAGFAPVDRALPEIHAGWGDRVTTAAIDPGTPNYSFQLPPFSVEVPEYRYRFCALFTRVAAPASEVIG
jgi:hypothetical protein